MLHLHMESASGPQPTLAHGAANGGSEPIAEASNLCCERKQQENMLRRREIVAASQR
jgi:hypothetical protein